MQKNSSYLRIFMFITLFHNSNRYIRMSAGKLHVSQIDPGANNGPQFQFVFVVLS